MILLRPKPVCAITLLNENIFANISNLNENICANISNLNVSQTGLILRLEPQNFSTTSSLNMNPSNMLLKFLRYCQLPYEFWKNWDISPLASILSDWRPLEIFYQRDTKNCQKRTFFAFQQITWDFDIETHIQGSTMWKLTSWGFRKCCTFWELLLLKVGSCRQK